MKSPIELCLIGQWPLNGTSWVYVIYSIYDWICVCVCVFAIGGVNNVSCCFHCICVFGFDRTDWPGPVRWWCDQSASREVLMCGSNVFCGPTTQTTPPIKTYRFGMHTIYKHHNIWEWHLRINASQLHVGSLCALNRIARVRVMSLFDLFKCLFRSTKTAHFRSDTHSLIDKWIACTLRFMILIVVVRCTNTVHWTYTIQAGLGNKAAGNNIHNNTH